MPSSDGIGPVKPSRPQQCCCQQFRSSALRRDRLPSAAGIAPVNRLLCRCSHSRLARSPSSAGSSPVSRFPASCNRVRLASMPSDAGIGPVSSFSTRSSSWRLARSPNSAGMRPGQSLCCRLNPQVSAGVPGSPRSPTTAFPLSPLPTCSSSDTSSQPPRCSSVTRPVLVRLDAVPLPERCIAQPVGVVHPARAARSRCTAPPAPSGPSPRWSGRRAASPSPWPACPRSRRSDSAPKPRVTVSPSSDVGVGECRHGDRFHRCRRARSSRSTGAL